MLEVAPFPGLLGMANAGRFPAQDEGLRGIGNGRGHTHQKHKSAKPVKWNGRLPRQGLIVPGTDNNIAAKNRNLGNKTDA
jgi:hypothetical protein